MKSRYKFSIIVPAYNPGKKIIHCLKSIEKSINYFSNKSDLIYEVLVINDGGDEIDLKFNHNIKNLKQIKLKKNRGVGFTRQQGANISQYHNLFFIDSDLVIKKNTLYVLSRDFESLENIGSIGPIQNYKNLNKEYTSDFVCAKSCYGYENVKEYVEFSAIRSECCLINKNFLNLVGGWGFFPNAGGEEFDLGHRIMKKGKINYLTKNTSYSTYWDNITTRCKNVLLRTSNYLPVFLSRKKFESSGGFATLTQALSAFITLLIIFSLFFSNHLIQLKEILIFLFLLNIILELNFLRFTLKYFKKRKIYLYIIGIFLINISIISGFLLGIYNLIKFIFSKNRYN